MKNNIFLKSIILFFLCFSCDKKEKSNRVDVLTTIQNVTSEKYFHLDLYDDDLKSEYEYFAMFNKTLGFCNGVENMTDVEIRILSYQNFENSNYYRLVYSNNNWNGELYIMEGVTNNLIQKKEFTPLIGWKNFENAIFKNDVFDLKMPKYESNKLHPRRYTIQVITASNVKTIPIKDFYNFNRNSDTNLLKIKSLMQTIISTSPQ